MSLQIYLSHHVDLSHQSATLRVDFEQMIRQCLRFTVPSNSVQLGFQTRCKRSLFHRQDSSICHIIEDAKCAVLATEDVSPLVQDYLRELGLNDDEITYSITEGVEYWNRGPIPELTVDSIDSTLTYLIHNDIPVRSAHSSPKS